MRKRFLLVFLLVIVVGCGGIVFGTSHLSGKWESSLAFDLSGPTLVLQTDSYTYSKLTLDYTLNPWTFKSVSSFDTSGLSMQEFSASGSLGLLILSSRLTFSPILGATGATLTYSNSTNTVEHTYNLGRAYFVDWVSVTSITMDAATSQWRIRVSRDSATGPWVWTSQVFTGNVASGQVAVGRIAQYVQIYAVTGGGYVDDSSVTIAVSGQSWVNTVRLVAGGLTLDGTFTIASGGSSCSLGATGSSPDGGLTANATVYFDISSTGCSLSFDRVQGTFAFPFACLDKVTATWKISCTGFDELSFAVTGLDLGLTCITFDANVAFSLVEKSVTLTPKLNLGTDTCFTVYASLVAGPAGVWEITGLAIYGLGVKHDWNGVSFESLSYLDGIHRVKDTYWEKFVIKSTGDACCGGKLTFEVATYFQDAHSTLFDWAETDFGLSIDITSAFTATTNIVIDTTGVTDLILGIEFTW